MVSLLLFCTGLQLEGTIDFHHDLEIAIPAAITEPRNHGAVAFSFAVLEETVKVQLTFAYDDQLVNFLIVVNDNL